MERETEFLSNPTNEQIAKSISEAIYLWLQRHYGIMTHWRVTKGDISLSESNRGTIKMTFQNEKTKEILSTLNDELQAYGGGKKEVNRIDRNIEITFENNAMALLVKVTLKAMLEEQPIGWTENEIDRDTTSKGEGKVRIRGTDIKGNAVSTRGTEIYNEANSIYKSEMERLSVKTPEAIISVLDNINADIENRYNLPRRIQPPPVDIDTELLAKAELSNIREGEKTNVALSPSEGPSSEPTVPNATTIGLLNRGVQFRLDDADKSEFASYRTLGSQQRGTQTYNASQAGQSNLSGVTGLTGISKLSGLSSKINEHKQKIKNMKSSGRDEKDISNEKEKFRKDIMDMISTSPIVSTIIREQLNKDVANGTIDPETYKEQINLMNTIELDQTDRDIIVRKERTRKPRKIPSGISLFSR
jgi:hypothetical protein